MAFEVCALFPGQEFEADLARNARLVADLNHRVPARDWHALVGLVRWSGQPQPTEIARWLKSAIDDLPATGAEIAGDYPDRTYASADIAIDFTFLPRRSPRSCDRLTVGGPAMAEFPGYETRLRDILAKKGGSRSEHRDAPFAIFVNLRVSCDTEDLINALYGDEAIAFDPDDLDSARPIRHPNGFFARTPNNPTGRNQRVSCVFAMRGWAPGAPVQTEVTRFDNPFAARPFREGIVPAQHRFAARRESTQIRMAWV